MSLRVRPAEASDNPGILSLLAGNPQPGAIRLAFERSPDYFHGAGVSCETPAVHVVEPEGERGQGRVLGVFNVGARTLFVNGRPQPVRYAHDLRLDPSVRGGKALKACYDQAYASRARQEPMQAVILADNAPYLASVSRGRPGMPGFYPTGDIETSLITGRRSGRRGPSTGLTIRRAESGDGERLQSFLDDEGSRRQFCPRYSVAALEGGDAYYRGLSLTDYWLALDGDRIEGVVGVWDQKAFRQSRVVGYHPAVRAARPFYNAWSRLTGGMRLPPAGSCFQYLVLHTVLIRQHRAAVLEPLLDTLLEHYRPAYDALVAGFFQSDPLAGVPAQYRRRVLRSRHFLMGWDEDPSGALDDRIPYAEVARL